MDRQLGCFGVQHDVDLKSLLESLLFVAGYPVSVQDLAGALDAEIDEVNEALQALSVEYRERGIRLQRKGDQAQWVSAPEAAPAIERFLGLESSGKLSAASLETLSIVAYCQPVTRAQVEAIRGVDSSSVLRALVRRGLLEEIGRAETVGRPILFGTTFEFMQQFGLESERDLPDWETLEAELGRLSPPDPGSGQRQAETAVDTS
jgi:segregation and condensation protein B